MTLVSYQAGVNMKRFTFQLVFNNSETETLDGFVDENAFFLVTFAPVTKVLIFLVLGVALWIGVLGRYALIQRILDVGFENRPINLLMLLEEISLTAIRVPSIMIMQLVLVSGNSLESFVDIITNYLFGLHFPFCYWFTLLQIFGTACVALASLQIALFRYN